MSRPVDGTSGSSLLLIAMALLLFSIFLFLFPYSSTSDLIAGHPSNASYLHAIMGVMAPFATAGLVLLRDALALSTGRQLLNSSKEINLSQLTPWPDLISCLTAANVGVRVVGELDRVIDSGGSITASPRLVGSRAVGGGPTILIPALAWSRLRLEPAALAAVIGHELGHVQHRDLQLVLLLEATLRMALLVAAFVVLQNIATSFWFDRDGPGGFFYALLANLAGKSSDLAIPVLMFVAAGLVRASQNFREAMADQTAIRLVGAEGLDRAEAILGGALHGSGLRPWRRWTPEPLARWPPLLFATGFIVSAFAAYAASPLAFACNVSPGGTACAAASVIFPNLQTLCAYLMCCAVLTLDVQTSRWSGAMRDLAVTGAGWIAGFLLTQTLPGALTALPLFDGYPSLLRHDPIPLLICDAAQRLTVFATAASVALATYAATVRASSFLWIIAGGLALCICDWEVLLSSDPTLGLAGPAAIILVFVFSLAFARPLLSLIAGAGLTILCLIALTGWAGLGGPASPAIGLEIAGISQVAHKQFVPGFAKLRLAARLSAFSADYWIQLSHELESAQPGSAEAIATAESGLRAPYLSDWGKRAEAAVWVGSLRIQRRRSSEDWSIAERELRVALDLWRRSTRVPKDVGVVALYNLAIIDLHRHHDPLNALLKLNEAAGEDTRAVKALWEDPDLASLNLQNMPSPSAETVQRLRQLPFKWITFERDANNIVAAEQQIRFLALLLRCQANHAGLNVRCAI